MSDPRYVVSVERTIPSAPGPIFDLLADPAGHARIDGSGTVRDPEPGAPERLSLGSSFTVGMRRGARYRMTSTVIEFEEDRRIAWAPRSPSRLLSVFGGRVWRYELEPVEGGTLVRETWDITRERGRSVARRLLGAETRRNMERTLARIEALVTASS
jgi:uncharacterized protein YndB with AHSA1/START domain